MWWVPPALSSQRHPTHGYNLSSPLSKKTFPCDVKLGDLTNHDCFLLCSRLNKNMGIVAYHQSGDDYKLSSMTKKKWPAHSRKTLYNEMGYCDNCQSGVSTNSSFPYMKGCQTIEELIQMATSHGDLSPEHLSAFWSQIPWTLATRRVQIS